MNVSKLKLIIACCAMSLATTACTQDDLEPHNSSRQASEAVSQPGEASTTRDDASSSRTITRTAAGRDTHGEPQPAQADVGEQSSNSCGLADGETGCFLPPVQQTESERPSQDDCGPEEDGCGSLPDDCGIDGEECEPTPEPIDDCGSEPDEEGCEPLPDDCHFDGERCEPAPPPIDDCGSEEEEGCEPLPYDCDFDGEGCEPAPPPIDDCGLEEEEGCQPEPPCGPGEPGCEPYPEEPSDETCDGLDNDFDGAIDEAAPCDDIRLPEPEPAPHPPADDFIAADCSEYEATSDDSPTEAEVCASVGLVADGNTCWIPSEQPDIPNGQSGAVPPTLNPSCVMVQYCIARDFTDAFACLLPGADGAAPSRADQ